MAGVDPNGEGVLPQTDDGAAYAGMTSQEMSEHGLNTSGRSGYAAYRRYKDPRSLEGLKNWIVQQGIPLPVGSVT